MLQYRVNDTTMRMRRRTPLRSRADGDGDVATKITKARFFTIFPGMLCERVKPLGTRRTGRALVHVN